MFAFAHKKRRRNLDVSLKITILRQKIIFFPMAEGGAKISGVFRVENHDLTPTTEMTMISLPTEKLYSIILKQGSKLPRWLSETPN
jgi:hypothetical protein